MWQSSVLEFIDAAFIPKEIGGTDTYMEEFDANPAAVIATFEDPFPAVAVETAAEKVTVDTTEASTAPAVVTSTPDTQTVFSSVPN
jgi:hypothetical protein